ncbi:hypothetical protein P3S68_000979 [Capsicum galapagoense]
MEECEQEREKELGKNCSTDHDARSNASSHKCRAESDAESLSRACNEWRSKSSTAVSFLVFMALVIFQIILDGHFTIISLYLFKIWDCRLLEKLKYLFHKEGES